SGRAGAGAAHVARGSVPRAAQDQHPERMRVVLDQLDVRRLGAGDQSVRHDSSVAATECSWRAIAAAALAGTGRRAGVAETARCAKTAPERARPSVRWDRRAGARAPATSCMSPARPGALLDALDDVDAELRLHDADLADLEAQGQVLERRHQRRV